MKDRSRELELIFNCIEGERDWQDTKHGVATRRNLTWATWLTILTEEVGEVAQAVLKLTEGGTKDDLRGELIQAAAVATAMLEVLNASDPAWQLSREVEKVSDEI